MRLPGRRKPKAAGPGEEDPTRLRPAADFPDAPEVTDAQDSTGGGSSGPASAAPGLAPEDPRRRAVRLRRRRRLLTWGGAPAAVILIVSLWMVFVWTMTMAANRAAVQGDYGLAVSRYRTVAAVNPLLEQWRVHYNLGTASLLAQDLDTAAAELEAALPLAPRAEMVSAQDSEGNTITIRDPYAPECLVRVNLYVTRSAQAQAATDAGDAAAAEDYGAQATSAAGECEMPPPQSADPTASPSQSSEPTASPSPTDTSTSPTPDPSSSPTSSAGSSSSPTSSP
ncbi:MAG: hypothetical protein Q4C85_09430, partial [Actinomyces sp.]|uniref:hypothetical protein n=1 Tax=Actinomyces sp. TaxID=29317 RepID=UPI0026DC5958